MLAEIAGILKASIRGSDAAVRYGGDEFLILLADSTIEGSEKVVQRITGRIEDWNSCEHLEGFRVTLSIGAAQWKEGDTLDEVLDGADRQMYQHKIS
jgi:diguanylate cyclase (GGDEF)-like protein